ncbi:hypothetical protein C7974DRAFT_107628 [Boeremia exigua]|uniref:uncharacterized protein n=1 Tax=Boeremia exigua TaxID=749465 RepID=UPI001E8EE9CE|nr:uncharacterized protein C7974DRAFT_107628 [Boeremia exigua]KAH6642710.1 hypothetical protein C7974DRAFT_107628 [Boeremia exigua]
MKLATLALSVFGLASLTGAQNGNDGMIQDNPTGPVVTDTFTTSYTKPVNACVPVLVSSSYVRSNTYMAPIFSTPVHDCTSLPLPPIPNRSNTWLRPTASSFKCWHNGYPCHRSQRYVTMFARATPAAGPVAPRVPPPEWFSTRTDVPLPGHTNAPTETGDDRMGILPIPYSLLEVPEEAVPSEPAYSALPIHHPASAQHNDLADHSGDVHTSLPTEPQVAARGAGVPVDWWRGPGEDVVPEASGPVLSQELVASTTATVTAASSGLPAVAAAHPTTDPCYRHYCPSGQPVVTPDTSMSTWTYPDVPAGTSHADIPPLVSMAT